MATKSRKKPTPMTLLQRIEHGTDTSVELVSAYLGRTPDDPGGCQTVARVNLQGSRIISEDLLQYMVERIQNLEQALALMAEQLEEARADNG